MLWGRSTSHVREGKKRVLRLHASCQTWAVDALYKLPENPLLYLFVKKLLASIKHDVHPNHYLSCVAVEIANASRISSVCVPGKKSAAPFCK